MIFDNFFLLGDGGGSSTLTGGDLSDSFFNTIVGSNGLIGSGTQLLVDAANPNHQFLTGMSMFTGGPTNIYSMGLFGTFSTNNATGDILLTAGAGVLGQWRVVSSSVPEPASATKLIAGCAALLLSRKRLAA